MPLAAAPFIEQLAAVGALAPSADNSQPWRLCWSGQQLSLHYAARHTGTNVFTAFSHATLLGVGALAENLDMALAANQVRGTWQWQTARGDTYGSVTLDHIPDQFTAPPGPRARHTNRLPFGSTPLAPALAVALARLSAGDNRLTILQDSGPRKALVDLVRMASEARFCDQALHAWLFGSLRYSPAQIASGDGLDIHSLGLPPGGRALMAIMADWQRMRALNRLGAYKLLARAETGLIGAAPALICLTGPASDRAVIDAGRLLNRLWTELNLQGLAVQPYYVVSDQLNRLHDGSLAAGFEQAMTTVERRLQSLLALKDGEQLHMILRVGPPRQAPRRSLRLPLAATCGPAS